jgi:ABC-type lipoprotein release transport system permease subunit
MLNINFIKFALKLLIKDKANYILSGFIFTFIIFIFSSILFMTDSIKYDLKKSIDLRDSIIVQNQKAGYHTQITDDVIDNLFEIDGISDVVGVVDGYYKFIQANKRFRIISNDDIASDKIDLGYGVKNSLSKFYYTKDFNFLTYDAKILNLKFNKIFPKQSNLLTNDLIMMNTTNAQKILGLKSDEYSYVKIFVPNNSEIDFIAQKIQQLYPNMKITTKNEKIENIAHLFEYKNGIFMILYVVILLSFLTMVYQQISQISGKTKKDIAILRSIGFSINDIIKVKLIQNIFISILSYIVAVVLAYIYIYKLDAIFLKNIFIKQSLIQDIQFTPIVDYNSLVMIFLFTVVTFLAMVIIPSWKVAISNINEALK